jgi:hypothetical protein
MKKTVLFFCLLIFTISTFSQEDSSNEKKSISDKKQELRIGTIKLLAEIAEVSYEYVNNANSGFGVSVLYNLEKNSDYLEQFSITPFYRMYFTSKEDFGAKGFFFEGHTKLATGEDPIFNSNEGKYTDFSIGFAAGQKWVNSNGFIVDLSLGLSRTIGNNSGHDVYFRGGLFIGYRF